MAEKDRASLLGLVAVHYQELVRRLTRRLGSPHAAADVAQETYLRLEGLGTVPDVRNGRAFLFRVADNLAIDHQRGQATRGRYFTAIDDVDHRASDEPDPETALLHKQRLRRLAQAVAELPPKCREVFLLHKLDGLTYGEIAARLGISRSAVEKHMIKALAHCRDRVGGA